MSAKQVYEATGRPWDRELIMPVRDDDFEVLRAWGVTPVKESWEPMQMHVIGKDEGKVLLPADLPYHMTNVIVLTSDARHRVGDLLERSGELLPLDVADGEYWIFHCLVEVDALDAEHSDITLARSGRVMVIDRHEFYADRLQGVELFKIPQLPRSSVFATGEFVEQFRAAGLVGTDFKLVWTEGN